MKTLQITYDLGSPETREDYERLFKYLRSFGSYAKPLYSHWFVKTDKSCETVMKEAREYVDANDKILVMDVTHTSWATSFSDDTTSWMKDHL